MWRWDQGRLDYFNFNAIRRIADTLLKLNGIFLRGSIDPIRIDLESATGLPFKPNNYSVWRNYARIFKCELLASRINGQLMVTDVCRQVASGLWDADDYFAWLINHTYFPSPVFDNYSHTQERVYPMCAVLKFLLARYSLNSDTGTDLDEIISFIVGNNCLGTEDLHFYQKLKATSYNPRADERRQIREMLIFMSQTSYLKWFRNRIFLDIAENDLNSIELLKNIAMPIIKDRHIDPDAEIISLGTVDNQILQSPIPIIRDLPSDISFTEGKRLRVVHLRIERSTRLRKIFLSYSAQPIQCDMCHADMNYRYPWTTNLIEIHHLLPLSSSIAFEKGETSINDLVGLCPNCHRSVHLYYVNWLREKTQDDFQSSEDARLAYIEAKQMIRL